MCKYYLNFALFYMNTGHSIFYQTELINIYFLLLEFKEKNMLHRYYAHFKGLSSVNPIILQVIPNRNALLIMVEKYIIR